MLPCLSTILKLYKISPTRKASGRSSSTHNPHSSHWNPTGGSWPHLLHICIRKHIPALRHGDSSPPKQVYGKACTSHVDCACNLSLKTLQNIEVRTVVYIRHVSMFELQCVVALWYFRGILSARAEKISVQ
jgi:hypothetical protein